MSNNKNYNDINDINYGTDLDDFESSSSNNPIVIIVFLGMGALILGYLIYKLLVSDTVEEVKKPLKEEKVIVDKKLFRELSEVRAEEVKKPLPFLPPTGKLEALPKKTYTSRIIKGGGSSQLLFSKNKKTNKSGTPITEPKSITNGQEVYRGGASTIAGVHQFKSELYLAKGTYIGCSLKTKLVSSVGGGVSCTVSNNIYSADGNVLLVERGSTITGSYKSGDLENGIDRHYVIWEEIRTPNNIVIAVDSGASDELGAAGIHGEVDNHWMMRFGGAVLLSLIDDGIQYAVNRSSKEGDTFYLGNTQQNAENMSNTALQEFVGIKPTLYKNQGDTVGVYVNKDIDFSRVYELTR
ncbi:MAG TPA: TrbI/VirB10 family protein [Sulfurovum sp.]|nr:TrbI/VirB10 family protein [Sulfurovum sp.]